MRVEMGTKLYLSERCSQWPTSFNLAALPNSTFSKEPIIGSLMNAVFSWFSHILTSKYMTLLRDIVELNHNNHIHISISKLNDWFSQTLFHRSICNFLPSWLFPLLCCTVFPWLLSSLTLSFYFTLLVSFSVSFDDSSFFSQLLHTEKTRAQT